MLLPLPLLVSEPAGLPGARSPARPRPASSCRQLGRGSASVYAPSHPSSGSRLPARSSSRRRLLVSDAEFLRFSVPKGYHSGRRWDVKQSSISYVIHLTLSLEVLLDACLLERLI